MSKKMSMNNNNILRFAALAVLVVAATLVVEKADAATYSVGGDLGWRVPSGADAYATWAAQNTYTVGDNLVFNFPTGAHDVAPVTKDAYDACNSSSTIALITVGPATINLNSPGPRYYICTFGQHCLAGQKLAINVSASSISPISPPTPTPEIPPPTPTPEVPPTASPIPPPPSTAAPSPAPGPGTPSPAPGPGTPSPSTPAPSSGPSPSGSDTPDTPSPGGADAPPGSQPGSDGGGSPPPSGATRKDVATIFVTMLISTSVGFMF